MTDTSSETVVPTTEATVPAAAPVAVPAVPATPGPHKGHIDPPLVDYSHPGFEFAGTTIAGENAMVCLGCGALVKSAHELRHIGWHDRAQG